MKPAAEGTTIRLLLGEKLSAAVGEIRSALCRTCLLATGSVDGFTGLCFAQQGCCAPQGISEEFIATKSAGMTLG
jgi:hypothetical protein